MAEDNSTKNSRKTAAPKKVPGKPFKKGESGNPNGRPPIPPEVKAIRAVTNEGIKEVMDLLLDSDYDALEEIVGARKGHTNLKKLYAACVLRAIKEGNPGHIEPVLNRVLGRPKETVEMSGQFETKNEHTISVSERIALMKGKE